MIEDMLVTLIQNKENILDNLKQRVRQHRNSGSTEVLVNALINSIKENSNREVKATKLDGKGLEILFLIQNWKLAHAKARKDYLFSELPALAEELEIC